MGNKDMLKSDALEYHSSGRKGKIEVIPTKNTSSQRSLALAYSPGVAEPCLEIFRDPATAYEYTTKGNLVAVITNGTAVLGLGDIGPLASKPVMEGKGLLFKIFSDIDVFDIEVNENDPDKFVEIVKAIAPTFGGINLEDIKAPEAFYIEERLKKELDIPVMHDDQHGTAIISGAALINAIEIAEKQINKVKIVVNGAGASAISCAKLYCSLGVDKNNIYMFDSKGLITNKRENLDKSKQHFARIEDIDFSLDEALVGADVFIGLSVSNILKPETLKSMAANPIVFALANPDPEIDYHLAMSTRDDIIMATGRSDYPNQVNNVLGFPFIFRGALDSRASNINEEMKLAATHALAQLAKESVPESVLKVYNERSLTFGKNYIIPKPFDHRLMPYVATAVVKAAIESGVAQKKDIDLEEYQNSLQTRMMSEAQKIIRFLQNRAQADVKTIAFSNAEEYNVLKAAQIVEDQGIANPILLGNEERIRKVLEEHEIDLKAPIIDPMSPSSDEKVKKYAEKLWQIRERKGMTPYNAKKSVQGRDYYGSMMVLNGEADAFITGYSKDYSSSLKPPLEVLGPDIEKVFSMMILLTKKGPLFFADTAVIPFPKWEDLVMIVKKMNEVVKIFGVDPKIAMLSYENFSAKKDVSKRVSKAVSFLHENHPEIIVDGEIQPDYALRPELIKEYYPFSKLAGHSANVFVFPNLTSGNLSYKIASGLGPIQCVGPVLLGLSKPVQIMQMRSSVQDIVNLTTIAALDAQQLNEKNNK